MRKILFCLILFSVGFFKAQQTVNHHVDFSSGNQNMWGPSFNAFSFNQVIPIFDVPWNVNFDTGNGGIVNILGQSFGAGIAGHFSGNIGMEFALQGFTTGEVAVDYPVDITLDMPVDNTYDQGDLVTIETDYAVTSGYSLDTYFPSVGEATLDLYFQLGASLSATICVFGCVTFPVIPSFNTGVQNINIFTVNQYGIDFFSFNGGTPAYSYSTGLPLNMDVIPQLGDYGLSGELDLPYVTTDDYLSGGNLYACGDSIYSYVNLDIFALLGNIPGQVGLVLGNLSGSQDLAGIATVSWNFFSASFQLNNSINQCFDFEPSIFGKFEFPIAVDYSIKSSSGSVLETGTSSIINAELGNDIEYNFPCHYEEIDIEPTYSIDGIFTNHTYDSIGFDLNMSAFGFGLDIPGVQITPAINIPSICVDIPYPCPTWSNPFKICWTELCSPAINIPAVGWSGYSLTIGPLWSTSIPLGSITFDLYKHTWSLEGFSEYTKPIFTMKASPLSITNTSTNILCYGDNSGSINTSISSISPALPYTYTWTNGASSQNLSGLPAGPYEVSVYDNNGCQLFTGATITEPAQELLLSYSHINKSCNGGVNDGSIDLLVQGGTLPYSFNWSNGSSTEDISSLDAGTYNLTVTDGAGCQKSISVVISEPNLLGQVSAVTHVNCNGNSDGEINIDVYGGTLPYTYLWSTGQIVDDLNGLNAGSYTLTVTDGNLCTSTQSHIVNQPATAIALSETATDVLCYGDSTGAVDITVVGGTAGYSFLWSSSLGTVLPYISEDVYNIPAATYTIIVTDGNGCVNQINSTINQPNEIVSNNLVTQINCHGDNTGSIDPNISGGMTPYNYLWSNGITNSVNSNLIAGNYNLVFTDGNSCVSTYNYTLTQPSLPLSLTIEKTDVLCFGDSSGSLIASVSGGTSPYYYAWSNGNTNSSILNLVSGTYTLTVTDTNACSVDTSIALSQPSSPLSLSSNITDILCYGDATGSIDLSITGGVLPYSVQWSNSGSVILVDTTLTLSSLIADSYIATITDSNMCQSILTSLVDQPNSPISISELIIDANCYNSSDGSIDVSVVGGTSPYQYLWSNTSTTQDLINIPSNSYDLTVTDSNGCLSNKSFDVYQPLTPLTVVTNPVPVNCKNGTDGYIETFVSGGTMPYSYSWSNSSSSPNIYNLPAGTYTLTVTDQNSCTSFTGALVEEPLLELDVNTSISHVSCYGYSDGSIDLSINGGTQPYYFNWGNQNEVLLSNSGQILEDLPKGNYFIRVRDNNSCVNEQIVSVNEPAVLAAVAIPSSLLCFADSSGAIDLVITGGTPPFTYQWSNGEITEDLTNLSSGYYDFIAIDSNSCELNGNVYVGQPDPIVIESTITPLTCIDQSDASIEIEINGGTTPYNFIWNNGVSEQDLIQIISGDYSLVVSDFNLCSFSETFTVPLNTDECLDVPNTITPNGDNYNDTWVLDNLYLYPNAIVKVFNKWGKEVYSSVGLYEPWDGTKDGVALPSAVYYYIIKLENPKDDQYTGTITIIR